MDSLSQTKAALEAGLLLDSDFEAVKAAFVKAQQIKAGFDANLLSQHDAQLSKEAFLKSILSSDTVIVSQEVANVVAAPVEDTQPSPTTAPTTCIELTAEPAVEEHVQEADPAPIASAVQLPSVNELRSESLSSTPKSNIITSSPTSRSSSVSSGTGVSRFGRSVSGYEVTEECVATYKKLVTRSSYSYIIFKLNELAGTVEVGEEGAKGSSFADFIDSLPEGDPRYAVFDYAYTNDDGCKFNKILFVMWAPEGSPLKNKMLYASSKDYFKRHLDGIGLEIQATDFEDLEADRVREKVRDVLTRK